MQIFFVYCPIKEYFLLGSTCMGRVVNLRHDKAVPRVIEVCHLDMLYPVLLITKAG